MEDDPTATCTLAMRLPSLLNLSATVPGSRDLAGALRQPEQGALARPARGLDDCPGRAAGQGHHVQAVQRCAHSTFAQATAAQYLQGRARLPATLAHVRKVYAERPRPWAMRCAELGDAIEFLQPQGGLFVWARLTGAGKVADGNVLAARH